MSLLNEFLWLKNTLSKQELLDLIIYTTENEILSNIISIIDLPPFHDKKSRLKYQFRKKRIKKRYLDRIKFQNPDFQDNLIQEFRFLKEIIHKNEFENDDSQQSSVLVQPIGDISSSDYEITLISASSASSIYRNEQMDGIPFSHDNYLENQSEIPSTINKTKSMKWKKDITINFHDEIIEIIEKEPFFLLFIRQIELGLRIFAQYFNLNLNCDFYIDTDFEIRDWKKIKLNILLPDEKLTFDEKIKIWDKIDEVIQIKINSLKNLYDETEKIKLIDNYNQKFFIDINPL
ncbi:MAG: hypothetical protein ACTSO9_06630 [Candidatus Helarchaeota archaeon]